MKGGISQVHKAPVARLHLLKERATEAWEKEHWLYSFKWWVIKMNPQAKGQRSTQVWRCWCTDVKKYVSGEKERIIPSLCSWVLQMLDWSGHHFRAVHLFMMTSLWRLTLNSASYSTRSRQTCSRLSRSSRNLEHTDAYAQALMKKVGQA